MEQEMDVKTFLNTLIPKFYKHLEQFEKKYFLIKMH